jgi:hypothetical protein
LTCAVEPEAITTVILVAAAVGLEAITAVLVAVAVAGIPSGAAS